VSSFDFPRLFDDKLSLIEPPPIIAAPTSVTAFVGRTSAGPTDKPVLCESLDHFEQVFGGLTAESDLPQSVQLFFLNGGTQALISRVGMSNNAHSAIDRLSQADDVNLMCILPPRPTESVALATWLHAREWCEDNDAMLFVDPPSIWKNGRDAAALAGGFDQLRSPNVMMYFPRLEAADPLDGGRRRVFPPSGAIAGLIARTDQNHGVWRSAAGLHAGVRGVTGLEHDVSSSDSVRLNISAVNALRTIPRAGTVAWGGRTSVGHQAGRAEWKYISVRRMALFIRTSIERSLQWARNETDHQAMRGLIILVIDAFMDSLYRQGAFAGSSRRDAWAVSVSPSAALGTGHEIHISFAPLRPAEFVTIKVRISPPVPRWGSLNL